MHDCQPGCTSLAHVCVSGCCLGHRREVYWSWQDLAWVHQDGWPCSALAPMGEP